jgi:hypothetical protein
MKVTILGENFRHQKAIKDILNEKDVRGSHIYLAKTEGEYKQTCQLQCALARKKKKTKETPLAAIAKKLRKNV